jgi:hypothetical protein
VRVKHNLGLIFVVTLILTALAFLVFAAPSLETVTLSSSDGTNTTNENLTITTDQDNNASIKLIYNWYKDEASITALNMPFEADGASNATDYSGNNNDGTVTSAIWNATGGYDGNGAYEMNGSNYGVTVADDQSLNITEEITITAWIYPLSSSGNMDIVTKKNWDSVHYGYRLQQNWGNLLFVWGNGTNYFQNKTGTIEVGKWQHVAVTYDQETLVLYIDGVAVLTESRDEPIVNNDDPILIGCYGHCNGATYVYNGSIDDVMIFNHALSSNQIQSLYENRTNSIVSQETLLGDVWNVTVTPNDGIEDGATMWSNALTVITVSAAVPEFSDYAIALLLLTVVGGFMAMRKKQN